MRVFPLAWRGLAITLAIVLVSSVGASADNPTEGELQVRLVESRQQLNGLYMQSAMASERLNAAAYSLEQAEASLVRQTAEQARASDELAVEKESLAALTVEQMQSGSAARDVVTLLGSDGPEQLLDRASAQSTSAEVLAARIDAFSARQVVYDSAVREAEAATDALRAAEREQQDAQEAITASIAAAEEAEAQTRRERTELLAQLASARGTSVGEVTSEQDEIDQRLDQSGPDAPATPVTDEAPTPDEPEQPADEPTTPAPAPTTPRPTPTPTKPPPSDPPPASGSKVDKAIAFARAQLGEPYAWGGAGPRSWDCSGLTMRAWEAAGVKLPRPAGPQFTATKKVSVSSIKRGDLLFWSNGSAGSIYHSAMYLGGGQMIHAPRPGRNVEIVPLSYWIQPDLASRPGA